MFCFLPRAMHAWSQTKTHKTSTSKRMINGVQISVLSVLLIVCRFKAGKEGKEALISPTRNRRVGLRPSQLCSRGRRSRSLICRISRLPCRSLPPAGLSGRSAARARPPIARGVTCKASEMSPTSPQILKQFNILV